MLAIEKILEEVNNLEINTKEELDFKVELEFIGNFNNSVVEVIR